MKYPITIELGIPAEANRRFENLSFSEVNKRGYRVIGGDKGDLHHQGYTVENDRTILYKPVLSTTYDDLTEDEANEIAQEILDFAFNSLGVECVY